MVHVHVLPRARRLVVLTALAVLVAVPAAAAGPGGAAPREGSAGSSLEAARGAGTEASPRVGPTVPGIDVSHWQGEIDWASVARDGKRFAFMKATDGVDYVDPTFARNRAEARDNGLAVGAYHFARPDPRRGDARREARHFVDVADPRPGDLLPVLDLETSSGLDRRGVTRWARTWVHAVRRLTGVTPLVYTSPYGWATRTGDTRLLARDGAPLWVAHWGVSSPTLPADGWAGRGWVVWQHTATGHVPGIRGDVDLDRIAGTRLGVVKIRRLTLDVTGDAGRIASGPSGLGCSATCAHRVDPDAEVTLTAVADDQAVFAGWTGACDGTAPTCTVSMRGNRDVGARFVSDVTPPTATILPPADVDDATAVAFDEPVRNVGPGNLVLRSGSGERVAVRRVCRSATGRPVGCETAAVRSVAVRPATPLVPGRAYEISVNPDGAAPPVRDRAGNAARPARVAFEASRVVEQGSGAVRRLPRDAWTRVRARRASGGGYALARRGGAVARLAFDGVGVDWITVTGPDRGRAQIFVDGGLVRTEDLFSRERTFGVEVRVDGLEPGTHVVRVVATGRARPASRGTGVAVDRFDVRA
jgi:GH25 family lysozyme M1 (1,4-beta-N-acetylmuramidase)